MSVMNEMYLLNAMLEVFAALVLVILLLGCLMERRHSDSAHQVLIAILGLHIGTLLSDALSWWLLMPPARGSVQTLQALTFLNYAMGCTLIALYAYYLVLYISRRKPISLWYARGIAMGCAVAVLLWFVNLFNGMYVYYDENVVDHLGPLYWLSQALAAVLPAATMLVALKHRKLLGGRETLAMMSYGALPMLAIPLQYYWLTTPLLLATTLSLVLVYTVLHVEERKRAVAQEKLLMAQALELTENRIAIMLSQIQPHFLYNALTTIKHLCAQSDPRAEGVVASFAKYLRGNMDSLTSKVPIAFESELKHLESYLAIERLRFPKVAITYDIAARDFSLPALTIQPLVENAIRYGVTRRHDGTGTVTLSSWEEEEAWMVRIADNGVGFDPQQTQYDGRSHIGLSNTRNRLEAMCGGTLFVESVTGVGTKMTIMVPRRRTK